LHLQTTLIKRGFQEGIIKGWRGFLWMMKLMIPISFGTMLLSASGTIVYLEHWLSPAMELLSLPPAAALPLILGLLLGIYAALAAMVVLPLTTSDLTLLAVFLLIAHSLIQEGIIQGKSGINIWKITLVRLGAAIIAVLAVAPFLPDREVTLLPSLAAASAGNSWGFFLTTWMKEILTLAGKIFVIIMFCLTMLEILKKVGFINGLTRPFLPLIKLMGLRDKTGFIWLTAVLFGVVYGAAVIVEEAREGHLTENELEALHLSIGINHAVVEDPLLFITLGIGAFWVYVPRLLAAILVVRLFSLLNRRRLFPTTVSP
jgi:hypothetical protein